MMVKMLHLVITHMEKNISVNEFLMLLVNHIIPTNFKTIRYYGFYRKAVFNFMTDEAKSVI